MPGKVHFTAVRSFCMCEEDRISLLKIKQIIDESKDRYQSDKSLTPQYWYACSPYSLYIFYGACKENLSDNRELLEFLIMSLILMKLMFDLGVIL